MLTCSLAFTPNGRTISLLLLVLVSFSNRLTLQLDDQILVEFSHYTSARIHSKMDQEDHQFFRDNNVNFEGAEYFAKPIYDYRSDSRLNPAIMDKLAKLNYVKPTPIQAISIPMVLDNKDFIGISQTGSGKTLAFLLPAFVKLSQGLLEMDGSGHGPGHPSVMVLAPTRELALQTKEVVDNFALYKAVCCYGGSSRYEQVNFIKRFRPPIIIGTPGRINDLMESNVFETDLVKYLVLDEADRMLDMGFFPQISRIIDQCGNKDRQTLLFSATWEGKVEHLANPFLHRDRVFACIGALKLKANTAIKQHIMLCTEYQKKNLLKKILKEFTGYKVIVFANTKLRATELSSLCDRSMGKAEYIHGDVEQARRTRLVKEFDNGRFTVLFATDVASRGLDIDNIHVVVNYDFPNDVETYVHRIGRSGRNGKTGKSFTLVTDRIFSSPHIHRGLLKVMRESGNTIPSNLNY